MPILIECSGCGKRYQVGDALACKRVRCGCGRTLTVRPLRPASPGNAAEDELQEWLSDRTATDAGPPAPEPAADELPGNLLDGIDWDTAPPRKLSVSAPGEGQTGKTPPAVLPMPEPSAFEDNRPLPPSREEAGEAEEEAATFWDRLKSPRRELIARLAVVYGAAMASYLLALAVRDVVVLSRFSELAVMILIVNRSVWIALAVLIAVGGILIRKRHPLGPPCAGIASVATSFSWLWSLLWAFHPIYIFLPIFAIQFPFIHAVPVYVTYWCLKEEEAGEEAARLDDHYAIRDALKERAIEENQKRWQSQ